MFTIEETTRPYKVLIYGQAGVGKSTLASKAPGCAFIDLEEGSPQIRVPKAKAKSYTEVIKLLEYSITSTHDTIVIDSYTYLEKMIHQMVANSENKKHISDIGFNKGYKKADQYWSEIQLLIRKLVQKKNVIGIAHANIQTIRDAMSSEYDEFRPALYKDSVDLLMADFDAIFFLKPELIVTDEKAIRTNKTFIYTQPTQGVCAKSRFNLPAKINRDEWDWSKVVFQY